jgi:type IV pilus assembly protein PilP
MDKNMKISLTFLVFLLMLGLAGCSKDRGVNKPAQKPKAAASEAILPSNEEKVEKETYTYEVKGRRDPFTSLIAITKEKPQRKKGANPIENFDVDEIRLSAIVWDNQHYYALVTLPDNKSYTLRKGMTLGLYGGKVEEITRNSVLIREQVKDYRGRPKTKDTLLKLRKEEEE